MLAPRWSNLVLGSVALVAALGGFALARVMRTAPLPVVSSTSVVVPAAIPAMATSAAAALSPAPVSEKSWLALRAQPNSQSADENLIAQLEALAAADPATALRLAQNETQLRLRWELFRALLRGWSHTDAEAALTWALSQHQIDRPVAIDAILAGVIANPAQAIAIERRAVASDAANANTYGNALLSQLAQHGEFERAVAFAAAGAPEVRADWLAMTYNIWASHQPDVALAAAARETDAATREPLLRAVIEGWAQAAPAAVADYAVRSLTGEERAHALELALRAWSTIDVVAAAEWVGRLDASPENDAALATLATATPLEQRPELALKLAQQIADAHQRTNAVMEIMREWSVHAPDEAQRFAADLTGLSVEEKAALIESLHRAPQ